MKNILRSRTFIVVLLAIIAIVGIGYYQQANAVSLEVGNSPLRLHIRANSDAALDQSLKLKIRDKVIVLLADSLAEAKNKEEAMAIVEKKLPQIEELADQVLAEQVGYKSKACLTNEQFPTINYDGTVLNSGYYDSLTITLGAGAGHNWWCVLFPPLCFVDIASETEAVDAMATENNSQPTVEVHSKLADWLSGH